MAVWHSMAKLMHVLSRCPGSCRQVVRTWGVRTDYQRWRTVARQAPLWDERNIRLARHIDSGKSVMDFGAGAQTLRRHLGSRCRYQPCDLIRSTEDSLLCDFNKDQYPTVAERFDYVVCSGVLEYARHPEHLLSRLLTYGDTILLTYAPAGGRRWETLARMRSGWVNHLTRAQLERVFAAHRLQWRVIDAWKQHVIYELKEPGRE